MPRGFAPARAAPHQGARVLAQPCRACARQGGSPPPPSGTVLRGDRRGGCAGGLTFAVTVCGRALTVAVPAVELALEAGGQGALGGQVILQAKKVILQAQDAQRRSQAVALVEQFPDPAGERQLAAGVAAVPAPRP